MDKPNKGIIMKEIEEDNFTIYTGDNSSCVLASIMEVVFFYNKNLKIIFDGFLKCLLLYQNVILILIY